MKIDNITRYTASRTIFWRGYAGNINQILELQSDAKHYAFDDNPQLIQLAFDAYFN